MLARTLSKLSERSRKPAVAGATSPPVPRAHRGSVGTGIAGVAEEASGVVFVDSGERWPEGCMQTLDRAGCGLAQQALDLGPGQLDRVEVGRVAGKIEVGEARAVEERAYGLRLVGSEIVHDQDGVGLAATQLGQQDLVQVGMEHGSVSGGGYAHGSDDTFGPERTQDSDAVPMATRCRAWGALAAKAPAINAHQIGQSGAFIDKYKALHGNPGHGLRPSSALLLDPRFVLLGRAQAPLFFASGAGVPGHGPPSTDAPAPRSRPQGGPGTRRGSGGSRP